jgi:hypothetical protein
VREEEAVILSCLAVVALRCQIDLMEGEGCSSLDQVVIYIRLIVVAMQALDLIGVQGCHSITWRSLKGRKPTGQGMRRIAQGCYDALPSSAHNHTLLVNLPSFLRTQTAIEQLNYIQVSSLKELHACTEVH